MFEVLAPFFAGIFLGVIWSFVTVTPTQFEQAVAKCESNGGLSKVIYATVGSDDVKCANGAKFTFKGDEK